MMDDAGLKKIGEVAELLGTTPRALRFYEEEGLVAARRTSGGTRLYSSEDIARFRAILRLAHSGMALSVIKELATARARYATGAEASHSIHSVLDILISKVQEQKAMLVQLEQELAIAAGTVESCFHCPNPPTRAGCPSCLVNRRLATSEILNLIWEQGFE